MARNEARESLAKLVEYFRPDYDLSSHQLLLCDKLDAVQRGEIKRLIVTMPPGHCKSEYVSRYWPAKLLGDDENFQLIAASHNSDLAAEFSYDVRGIMESDDFANIYDTRLAKDRKALASWRTTGRGFYRAAGVATSITGRRANGAIIDDPVKDREDADSETARKKKIDWFRSTLRMRLFPSAWIVLVLTRWHPDDIAGWAIKNAKDGGEKWEVFKMPGLIETPAQAKADLLGRKVGEALWPAGGYTADYWRRVKPTVGDREWASLIQGDPEVEGGDYFKREWFQYYDHAPRGVRWHVFSDLAVSESKDGSDPDYAVHIKAGITDNDDIYIDEIWRDRRAADEVVDTALDMIIESRAFGWINEKGPITKSLEPFIKKRMRERRVVVRWGEELQYAAMVDKIARARSFQARLSQGKVYLKAGASWLLDYEQELLQFPAVKHDDQVDASALIGLHLVKIHKPMPKGGPRIGHFIADFDPLEG